MQKSLNAEKHLSYVGIGEDAGKERQFWPELFVFNVRVSTLMDTEGRMASMHSLAHNSVDVVRRMFISLAWLHSQRKSRKTKGTVENILEKNRAVIGNVFRTETFKPLTTAETWDTKFEKLHRRGRMANQSEIKEVRNHSVYTSIYRDKRGGYKYCFSSETRRAERNISPMWTDLRVQQEICLSQRPSQTTVHVYPERPQSPNMGYPNYPWMNGRRYR